MPKLAANVSMMFAEVDFLQRFAAAARAGFRAVEYQYPYDWKSAELSAAVRDAGVEVVLHNMPPGDAALGERGTASLTCRSPTCPAATSRAPARSTSSSCLAISSAWATAAGSVANTIRWVTRAKD